MPRFSPYDSFAKDFTSWIQRTVCGVCRCIVLHKMPLRFFISQMIEEVLQNQSNTTFGICFMIKLRLSYSSRDNFAQNLSFWVMQWHFMSVMGRDYFLSSNSCATLAVYLSWTTLRSSGSRVMEYRVLKPPVLSNFCSSIWRWRVIYDCSFIRP
jgi:hypothetical protein